MPTFGNSDDANSAPKWALNQINLAPTQQNMDSLYNNTAGQYEIFAANTADAEALGLSPGWILVKRGTGNRSDRIQYEQLVVVHNIENGAPQATHPVSATLLMILLL